MPIGVAFAKEGLNVIGFDLNKAKIELYKSGVDPTHEVGDDTIRSTTVYFTADETDLKKGAIPYRSGSHTRESRSYAGLESCYWRI